MMYYRRKILLSLLQTFEGRLEKIRLQKLLFLFCQKPDKPEFHFVPYKYGCYSFQANADLSTLTKMGLLTDNGKEWMRVDSFDYFHQLKESDKKRLKAFKILYETKTSDDLIYITYKKFPFFAINSLIAETRLTREEYFKICSVRPKSNTTLLYTIGYEGVTLEEYLNKLILNDVKMLCDVRRNPLSMKYGFSKSQLKAACEGIGIAYLHLPEVGIASDLRQNLETQKDYDALFVRYQQECLVNTKSTQVQIFNLLKEHQRVALTCFEADICQCHRKPLAESIAELDGFDFQVKHL